MCAKRFLILVSLPSLSDLIHKIKHYEGNGGLQFPPYIAYLCKNEEWRKIYEENIPKACAAPADKTWYQDDMNKICAGIAGFKAIVIK